MKVNAMSRLFTGAGYAGTIGGDITVFGTSERETISVVDVAGTVTFDPSFNKGGDTIVLAKSAAAYTINQSGSSVVLANQDSRIVIPVGIVATTIQFLDGDRTLLFSGGVKIGSQVVTATAATVTAEGAAKSTLAADAAAKPARLVLNQESAWVAGNVTVFGSAGVESVSIVGAGKITFDPSFNRGGDTISLMKSAQNYTAQKVGSSFVLQDGTTTLIIPVGIGGLTTEFRGDARLLAFTGDEFKIGMDVVQSENKITLTKNIMPPLFLNTPVRISGIEIQIPYTVTEGKLNFKPGLQFDTLYFANNVLSMLPLHGPWDGSKDITIYFPELSFHLTKDLVATSVPSNISTQHPRDVVVADFNGDGISDVYIADHGFDGLSFPGGQSKLLLGTTKGFVDATQSLPQKLEFTHSATAADINGDGHIDLFVGNFAMNPPYFLINDGSANFVVKDLFPKSFDGSRYTTSLLADLDGDGTFELILGGDARVSQILIYTGDGYALSSTLTLGDDGARIVTSIELADLDGDGSLEIILQSTSSEPFYKGTRLDIFSQVDGIFQINESYSGIVVSEALWNKHLYVSDMNRDGKLDLISVGQDTKILLNDGSGFEVDTNALPFDQYRVNEMWDVNADGRLDFVYIDMVPNSLDSVLTLGVFVLLG